MDRGAGRPGWGRARGRALHLLAGSAAAAALLWVIFPSVPPRPDPRGSARPFASRAKPAPVQLPAPRPSAAAEEKLLRSKDPRVRRLAVERIADRPTRESLVVLVEHIPAEPVMDLVCQAVMGAKQAGRKLATPLAAQKLVELFERSKSPELRLTILGAFRLFADPAGEERTLLHRLAAAASSGEERERARDLLAARSARP